MPFFPPPPLPPLPSSLPFSRNFPSSPPKSLPPRFSNTLFPEKERKKFNNSNNIHERSISLSTSEFSPADRLFREMEHKGYRGLEGSDPGSIDDYNRPGTKVRGGYERHVRAGRRGGEERALDEHGGRGKSLNDIPSGPSSATQR